MKNPPNAFSRLKAKIRLRKGELISKRYRNNQSVVRIKCEHGHIWTTKAIHILRGHWCPTCSWKDPFGHINEFRAIAVSRHGELLSTRYFGRDSKLRFRCRLGHEWSSKPQNIRRGCWCPTCRIPKRITISEVRKLARNQGGRALTKSVSNADSKLELECAKKHRFKTSAAALKKGRWCPNCAGVAKLTIEEMRQVAKNRNGLCRSKKYFNNRHKLVWECKEKHRWKATPDAVLSGSWCPKCSLAEKRNRSTTRRTIEEVRLAAASLGYICLSRTYVNNKTHLKFRCSAGHLLSVAPVAIFRGTGCPHCSHRAPLTLSEIKELAIAKRGQCLSTEYVNNRTKLTFRCAKGHTWSAQPMHIKNGTWCPTCAFASPGY
jgi:hypothetical protein